MRLNNTIKQGNSIKISATLLTEIDNLTDALYKYNIILLLFLSHIVKNLGSS